ncbi:MAG: aminoacyl-tRNA hydrolase [Deltaproteobacteria bacterium]|nr:aminoacyl-tRNA hydrolase [Deltaproteobacteria bacterium]
MFLVVGLGNPGKEYQATRHNAGFMLVDRVRERFGGTPWQRKFKGEISEVRSASLAPDRVVLLKPLTYMNDSGESVRPAVDFYKLLPAQLVVCHDEIDLPMGTLRVKVGGGPGGHNGLRSVSQHLGPDYVRIRMGIGKPAHPGGAAKDEKVVRHVLGGFSKQERDALDDLLARAEDALVAVLRDGPLRAMNTFNTEPKKER